MKNLNFLSLALILTVSIFSFSSVNAQIVTNGHMDGPSAHTTVPSGWTASAGSSDVNSPGTSHYALPGIGSDYLFYSGGSTGFGASCDGGTAVGIQCESSNLSFTESLRQTITLTEGVTYRLFFEWANPGLIFPNGTEQIDDGRAVFTLNGNEIGTSSLQSVGSTWYAESFTFIPPYTGNFTLELGGRSFVDITYISVDNVIILPDTDPYPACFPPPCNAGTAAPIVSGN